MGFQTKILHSVKQASNYMFKLHATLLEAWRTKAYNSIAVYPIMDGAYVTSRHKNDLLNFLSYVFRSLAVSLDETDNFAHWYMVRAAIAYGDTIHGRSIPYDASYEFCSRVGYKEQLLLSPAMIEAYNGEKLASPMGVFICESAVNTRQGINSNWKWYNNPHTQTPQMNYSHFQEQLRNYLPWIFAHSTETEYPLEARKRHLVTASDYFGFKNE